MILFFGARASAGDLAVTGSRGELKALLLDGESIPILGNIRLPTPGWRTIACQDDATHVKTTWAPEGVTWSGSIKTGIWRSCLYKQVLREHEGVVHLDLTVTAKSKMRLEGVYYCLQAPTSVFGGGTYKLAPRLDAASKGALPLLTAAYPSIASQKANHLSLLDTRTATQLDIRLDRPCVASIQDNRSFKSDTYAVFVRFGTGVLRKGQSASLKMTIQLTGKPDHTPVELTVDSEDRRYKLDGFGGNYCFEIESPVTAYTLKNLRVAWARTEMTLTEWEPRNDNGKPGTANWEAFKSADKPDSNLRREFLLAQQIQKQGIPLAIAIWHLPEWLYEKPDQDPYTQRRRLHPGKWPELLESIGTYLLHAKQQYGVEPDLFSFNEPNIGIYVLFSPEEHAEALKKIGAHLAKLGLNTKMLLADATGPNGTHVYALPASKDAGAMQYVGAIGFHSWGGATPEQYGAWADLADRLRLPLLVAEVGVESEAWRTKAFRSFDYALREVRMYQDILLHARPWATMHWEFTSDYGLVSERKFASGKTAKLAPSRRFYFIKHFCNLTPRGADALATTSDRRKVMFTAFSGLVERRPVHTFHIFNSAASRSATLSGLPKNLKSLRAIRTSLAESFRELREVHVDENGNIQLALTARSLLTLTTMPVE